MHYSEKLNKPCKSGYLRTKYVPVSISDNSPNAKLERIKNQLRLSFKIFKRKNVNYQQCHYHYKKMVFILGYKL